MTGLKEALYKFWSQFGPDAYLSDCVPQDATLPYITYNVTQPAFGRTAVLTAFVWVPRETKGNANRTTLMDLIAEAIPVGGVMLPVAGGGYIVLERNDADFQTDWQDDTDTDVIGGRTSYTLRYYNT